MVRKQKIESCFHFGNAGNLQFTTGIVTNRCGKSLPPFLLFGFAKKLDSGQGRELSKKCK